MLELNRLTSLVKKRKRVGRGGSRGGTSGKGHKGQKARSGPHIGDAFEGGQMPLYRRLPKRGFNNVMFETKVEIVNLNRLESIFEDGSTITKELLLEKKIIRPKKNRPFLLKVLGDGLLKKKFVIVADKFSESAKQAIENNGGQARHSEE